MLHRAYEKNNINIIKLLLENKADINYTDKNDNTILHKACKENNVELAKFLIKKGANINCKNEDDNTALHIVCKNNNEELIKLLINKGANINKKNIYDTSCSELLWENGHKDIIKSYHNAFEIIYNDDCSEDCSEDFNPYLITKHGSIIDIYENEIIKSINNNSYLQVKLNNELYLIHILVANTFKPTEDKTLIVKHKDNNILNNNVDNLEWVKYELDLYHTEYICNIEFSEIPQFLYNSELYKNLESEDDFEILKKYYKNDLIINSIEDFIHMLYTLRYWCIEKIPYELYDYVLANKIMIDIYYGLLKEIFNDFYFLDEFKILIRYGKERICSGLAYRGMINCLIYARENGYPWDDRTCLFASQNGHLACLKYAHENDCPWDERTCWFASQNGHLNILKYAHENGCPWDKRTCYFSSWHGHLDCLKYAHENGCEWVKEQCLNIANKNNHLEIVKYIEDN